MNIFPGQNRCSSILSRIHQRFRRDKIHPPLFTDTCPTTKSALTTTEKNVYEKN